MPRPRFLKLDEERRRSILEAAKAEFAECGFEQASYNSIIEQAGLSKGAMYYYFDDKLDLYVTVLETVNDEMMEALGMGEDWEPDGDFWDAMRNMAVKGWEFAVSHAELVALLRSLQTFPVKARKEGRLGELFDVWRTLLTRLLEHGRERGQVRTDFPVALLVEVTVALDEAIDFWLLDNVELVEQERGQEELLEMVLDLYKRLLSP
jgi:AcrR family transcriptional regulator